MNSLREVADIVERLSKPTPPQVRAQLEWRIRELEAEYLEQEKLGRTQEKSTG